MLNENGLLVNLAHSDHCRACKDRIRELLTAIYGDCQVNQSFPWSSRPEDYVNTPIGDLLQRICAGVGALRGNRDFIKSAEMPPCDFYISDPPFILEFDESQHFSRARLITLSLYPEAFKLGFPLARWRELCREINAVDDQPFDRDERRAWYDALRDLLPSLHGFEPTVRLYAGEYPWCSLDASSDSDWANFRGLLGTRLTPITASNYK